MSRGRPRGHGKDERQWEKGGNVLVVVNFPEQIFNQPFVILFFSFHRVHVQSRWIAPQIGRHRQFKLQSSKAANFCKVSIVISFYHFHSPLPFLLPIINPRSIFTIILFQTNHFPAWLKFQNSSPFLFDPRNFGSELMPFVSSIPNVFAKLVSLGKFESKVKHEYGIELK